MTVTAVPLVGRPFEPLDLSVLGAGGGHVWLSVTSRQGEVHGVPRPVPDFAPVLGAVAPAAWFGAAISQARRERETALAVGRLLRDLVFGVPEIASLLEQTRGVAAGRGAQLLVRLLVAPSNVAAWPWELLVDPQHPGRFLALARDAHLVRTARARTYPARQAPIAPPLNVLLVLSSPLKSGAIDDEAVFDLYGEKRALLGELRPLIERGLLHVEIEERPSVERIRSRMARRCQGFHVVHYLGHARPEGLKLEDPQGRGRLVRSGDFSRLLQELPDLRLAVFAGCETARAPLTTEADRWPGQLSTTDHCVRDASPAVVGMQSVLPFETERLLTRFFYQSLTAGRSIADSLRLARLAVEGDEHVGGGLLDWAVPCLVVGGGDPGPLLDPQARPAPAERTRRASLRLDARQGDLLFFARQTELREAIDVLAGQNRCRLLQIVGGTGVGKSLLLDRVVEELDDEVARLAVSTGRLLAADDPVLALCTLAEEVLRLGGRRTAARGRRAALAWWERLLEDVADTPLAIALDDADALNDDTAAPLREALAILLQRRGRARLAVATAREITALGSGLPPGAVRVIRLQPLAWPEVWQWVRRNLPILTRYPEHELSPYFADLGAHLELWTDLAEAIAARVAVQQADLPGMVRDAARRIRALPSTQPPPPLFGTFTRLAVEGGVHVATAEGAPPAPQAAEPRMQPLRVAIAGPHTDGRSIEFSRAVTALAAQVGVGGRVVTADAADASSSLAQLLDLRSPFGPQRTSDLASLVRWIGAAHAAGADVILLDFGGTARSRLWDDVVAEAAAAGALLVAAAGHSLRPEYPAWLPGVLAVGALADDGSPAPYSFYDTNSDKPEIFAPRSLAGSPLAVLLDNPTVEGTSFAAMHAVAAAVMVWASDRTQRAADVRTALLASATTTAAGARRLDLPAALERVRRQQLLDALERGPLETGELLAETGLRSELALPLLDAMHVSGAIRQVTDRGVERWEHPEAVYLVYEQVRREGPSTGARTTALEMLLERIRGLARRGRFEREEVHAMWASDQEGRRISALVAMTERAGLRDVEIVLEAIARSRSAFEQYHALNLAQMMLPSLDASRREQLRAMLIEQIGPTGWIKPGQDRAKIAEALLTALGEPSALAPATAKPQAPPHASAARASAAADQNRRKPS